MARTPRYNQDIIKPEILEWIAGGNTLREFCRQDRKPSFREVYNWLEEDKDFAARFTRARVCGADVMAEECIEIADDGSNDFIKRKDRAGNDITVLSVEHIQRSKLRIETRLKLLAKWFPQAYGDKTILSNDPENPISQPMDDEARVARIAEILNQARQRMVKGQGQDAGGEA